MNQEQDRKPNIVASADYIKANAPAKIWIWVHEIKDKYGRWWRKSPPEITDVEYIRADIAEAECERLREFARKIILTYCWDLGDPEAQQQFDTDGGEIEQLAEKLGLIKLHIATAEDVTEFTDFKVGDTIYKFTDSLKGGK